MIFSSLRQHRCDDITNTGISQNILIINYSHHITSLNKNEQSN